MENVAQCSYAAIAKIELQDVGIIATIVLSILTLIVIWKQAEIGMRTYQLSKVDEIYDLRRFVSDCAQQVENNKFLEEARVDQISHYMDLALLMIGAQAAMIMVKMEEDALILLEWYKMEGDHVTVWRDGTQNQLIYPYDDEELLKVRHRFSRYPDEFHEYALEAMRVHLGVSKGKFLDAKKLLDDLKKRVKRNA